MRRGGGSDWRRSRRTRQQGGQRAGSAVHFRRVASIYSQGAKWRIRQIRIVVPKLIQAKGSCMARNPFAFLANDRPSGNKVWPASEGANQSWLSGLGGGGAGLGLEAARGESFSVKTTPRTRARLGLHRVITHAPSVPSQRPAAFTISTRPGRNRDMGAMKRREPSRRRSLIMPDTCPTPPSRDGKGGYTDHWR